MNFDGDFRAIPAQNRNTNNHIVWHHSSKASLLDEDDEAPKTWDDEQSSVAPEDMQRR